MDWRRTTTDAFGWHQEQTANLMSSNIHQSNGSGGGGDGGAAGGGRQSNEHCLLKPMSNGNSSSPLLPMPSDPVVLQWPMSPPPPSPPLLSSTFNLLLYINWIQPFPFIAPLFFPIFSVFLSFEEKNKIEMK